jgi:diguanylate cyclase (GGDEF)-like protein
MTMTTAVVAAAAATVIASLALLAAVRPTARSTHALDEAVRGLERHARLVSDRLERALLRADAARAQGVSAREATLDLDALLAGACADAAAQSGAHAVALRVEGPEGRQLVASVGTADAAILLERIPVLPDARPSPALTFAWSYCDDEASASGYRSALVVPIVEDSAPSGVLVACAMEADAFRPEHVEAVERLARGLAPRLTSARLLAERQHRASTDPATGLRNGAGYELTLERELERARRTGRSLSLLVVHAHPAPDQVADHGQDPVAELASLLSCVARESDVPCRPRSHELVVVLAGADEAGARRVYDRLREEARRANAAGSTRVSAGVVEWRSNEPAASLADRATRAAAAASVEPLVRRAQG